MNLRLFQTFHLAGQYAQINLAQRQLQQQHQANQFLSGIQLQLEQQRASQQRQALLQQVLFETERAARDIVGLANRDWFAAGVHARMRLQSVNGIDATQFQAFEHKKVWSDAVEGLQGCWRTIEREPQARDSALRFIGAADTMTSWQRVLGPNPTQRLQTFEQQHGTAAAAAERAKLHLLIAFGVFATALLLTIILSAAADSGGCPGAFTFFGLIAAIALFDKHNRARVQARKAQGEHAGYKASLDQFGAFMQDPNGGQFLEAIAGRHPAVMGFDPAQNPPPSSARLSAPSIEHHVVERQVIVTRCKYCSALTPVDLAGCQNCGATLGK